MGVKQWDSWKMANKIMDDQERSMGKAVAQLIRIVKTSINKSNRSGNTPSRPGEPPRKVSGELYHSITGQVTRSGMEVQGYVGTNVPHGRRMELGFFGRDSLGRLYRQAARPYLRPALQQLIKFWKSTVSS